MRTSALHPAALWGIAGVVLLLGQAVWRLAPMALAPWVQEGFTPVQWALYAGFAVFMAWSEGYRGFQRGFSPRVVTRARALPGRPAWTWVVAPAVCMGLLHATRKRMVVSWSLTLGIVGLVLLVRQLPWDWRAIVDGGVVIGLGWGVASLLWFAVTGPPPATDPEFPA